MRVLVFGKNGQVGRALIAAANEDARFEITALDRDACDLMSDGAAARAIEDIRPDVVINAAAYTAVDKAETDIAAARRLNAEAPAEMAKAASEAGARFIHISTDYVFDGQASAPIPENTSPHPLNVYGSTKRDGERNVLTVNPDAVIIRTSWVFSVHGANFVKTMLRLGAAREELTIVADQIGGPTSAQAIAAAALLIARSDIEHPGGVYHFQGAPAVSWAGFAQAIFEHAGLETRVTPIETKDFPTPAARPLYTVLDCGKIEEKFNIPQPDWREDVKAVVGALASA